MYDVIDDHRGGYTVELRKYLYVECRGSIPSKVGFWVGLRMFLYVRTPTKITNAISKTQLLGQKKGEVLAKNTPNVALLLYLACFSSF